MEKKQKIIIAVTALIIAAGIVIFALNKSKKGDNGKQISIENKTQNALPIANDGPRSPISGLECENWNRRPLATMQAADIPARPGAGLSQADMVIEMPVITASVTRLMGVYVCNTPPEVGSMRSARHDFIHLAKGLDAIFTPWGRSESHTGNDPIGLAQGILDRNEVENINCNQDAGKSATLCSENPCFRKEGMDRGVDSGYSKPEKLWNCAQELGYRIENKFSGYPHQQEAPKEDRPEGGHLRVAYAGPFSAEYDYDPETNSYKRIWGKEIDKDRNNGERIAPKNIAVIMAKSEQIEGQYNNIQLGDPWYDKSDSGEAYYFMNGEEYRGTWKKDKGDISSKLYFYDQSGKEIMFVPGQIWVEVLEPGQALKWEPVN